MGEEWNSIKDAMALRGIPVTAAGILRHPMRTMEYTYVPMLVSASKISDEITQAAITRGIDHVQRRTCMETVRFHVMDMSDFGCVYNRDYSCVPGKWKGVVLMISLKKRFLFL